MEQNLTPDEDLEFRHIGNVLRDFRDIHTFIFDVDGVLTNSTVMITEKGELLRTMNIRDGYAIKRALQEGYKVMIITGGKSAGTTNRLKALGITEVYADVQHKLNVYELMMDKYHLNEDGILYMGDDVPDLEVLRRVGLPCCPFDAAPEVLEAAKYVSPKKGGEGCVRDVVEKVMKLNGRWK